jgi:hypothetical protein
VSQWRRLPPDRIRQVASALVEARHLLLSIPARDVAGRLGWPVVESMPASLALDPGLALDGDDATIGIDPDGGASRVTVALTSAVLESIEAARAFKNDVFAGAAEELTKGYGAPSLRAPGPTPLVEWRVDDGSLQLRDDWVTVNLSIAAAVAVEDLDGAAGDGPDDPPAVRVPPLAERNAAGLSWAQLSGTLARTLATLPSQAVLIINDRLHPERFVQYLQAGPEIQAFATGLPDHNDVPQLTPVRRRILEKAGWRPPTQLPFHWGYRLPWPARSGGYQELAERSVIALRDGYDVVTPGDLECSTWVNGSDSPLEIAAPDNIARKAAGRPADRRTMSG